MTTDSTDRGASWSKTNRIAFQSTRVFHVWSSNEIYTINPGGGGSKVQLTDNSTDDDGGLSYSPSGTKIAYSGRDASIGDYEIYTINSGGGGKVKVTDNSTITDDYYPSWGSS